MAAIQVEIEQVRQIDVNLWGVLRPFLATTSVRSMPQMMPVMAAKKGSSRTDDAGGRRACSGLPVQGIRY